MRYTLAMPTLPTLRDLAAQYQIDAKKAFFPVNSLRLLYFLILDAYTNKNADVRQELTLLIPQIEEILRSRATHRNTASHATLHTDFEAALPALRKVYEDHPRVNTSVIHQMFQQLFTYLHPLQDDIFLHLYQQIPTTEAQLQKSPLTAQTLQLLLRARAMDSLVMSTLLGQLLAPTHQELPEQHALALHHHIHLAYQLNDIVDTVVFAKDDLQAEAFSPLQVIRRIAPDPREAKTLITSTITSLREQANVFSFPAELQAQVEIFYDALIGVVLGAEVGQSG
jgi:hypothetical protein